MSQFYEDTIERVNGLVENPLTWLSHQIVPESLLVVSVGLCLKTFQIARPAWTTPYKPSPLKRP